MKKNHKKQQKLALIIGALIMVVGLSTVIGQSELFQGKLNLNQIKNLKPAAITGLYKHGNPARIVSAVTSPVSSIVVSSVTSSVASRTATSKVASRIASVVTSAVTSGVPVSAALASRVSINKLPSLTAKALKNEAKNFRLKNPAKFSLTNAQKKRIIDQYNTVHKVK